MTFPSTTASTHRLSNGCILILDPHHDAPVVSVQGWVETGSMHEAKEPGSGISHLLEHMVFKGTQTWKSDELAQAVQEAGGHWNAYTSFDRTVYYIDGPSQSKELFSQVVSELIFSPLLPEEDYASERDVIRREIDMGLDDPDSVNGQLLFSTAYLQDLRKHPVIGHLDRFDKITHADLVRYHQERYTFENVFFVVSGDFDISETIQHFEELLKAVENQASPLLALPSESDLVSNLSAQDFFNIPTSKDTLCWRIPGLSHADSIALDLLASVVGQGQASPLYQTFHEKNHLCHSIGAWSWNPSQGPGIFAISTDSDTSQRQELLSELKASLCKILHITDSTALSRAKKQCFATQLRTLTTASGRAEDLASNWHEARDLDFTKRYLENIEKLTAQDLTRVAETYILDQPTIHISLHPLEEKPNGDSLPRKESRSKLKKETTLHTLSNGLQVAILEDHRLPTVYLKSAFHAGLLSETPETNGISRLMSATMKKGTTEHSGFEISSAIENLGARLGISSGNNSSSLSGFCLSPDLHELTHWCGELMAHASYPAEALTREKEAQLADLAEAAQSPLKVGMSAARQLLFGSHPYSMTSLGSAESIPSLTSERLRIHHQNTFQPQNGVLSFAGDLHTDDLLSQLETQLSFAPSLNHIREKAASFTAITPGTHRYHVDKKQAVLVISFRGASLDSSDTPALDVIQEYCSDMAGPLFTKIREELGLAYYVSASQFHGVGSGMFHFYLGTDPQKLEFAKNALLGEIEKLLTSGIPPEDLVRTKATLASAEAIDQQSLGSKAQMTALDLLFGLGLDHHHQLNEKRQNITCEEIQHTTQKYFNLSQAVIIEVTPDA